MCSQIATTQGPNNLLNGLNYHIIHRPRRDGVDFPRHRDQARNTILNDCTKTDTGDMQSRRGCTETNLPKAFIFYNSGGSKDGIRSLQQVETRQLGPEDMQWEYYCTGTKSIRECRKMKMHEPYKEIPIPLFSKGPEDVHYVDRCTGSSHIHTRSSKHDGNRRQIRRDKMTQKTCIYGATA